MKKTKRLLAGCVAAMMLLSACQEEETSEANTFVYTFEQDTEGWEGGFADYPIGREDFELVFARERLPQPLDSQTYALRVSGTNMSDDLFMFIKHKIESLQPDQNYQLTFNIRLASDAPDGSVGIGGSPANSVFLKAGAVPQEPMPIQQEGYWRMNIDKGNQANGGADMMVLGDIATNQEEFGYAIIERSNRDEPLTVTTNEEGSLWVVLGTDSGFEGNTAVYYSQIGLEFEPIP